MLAVVRDTWDYVQQMIPLGLIALMILLLRRPMPEGSVPSGVRQHCFSLWCSARDWLR